MLMDCVECEPGRREVQALHKGWGMDWLAADARASSTLWRFRFLRAKQIPDRSSLLPEASLPEREQHHAALHVNVYMYHLHFTIYSSTECESFLIASAVVVQSLSLLHELLPTTTAYPHDPFTNFASSSRPASSILYILMSRFKKSLTFPRHPDLTSLR